MDTDKTLKEFILAKTAIDICRKNKRTISIAESCTGGLISSAITSVPGSSDVFECCLVTYSNKSKQNLLNVTKNSLNSYGAVSEEVVIEMLKGLIKKTNSDILLSISGIAGPGGGTIDKPEGLIWIAYAFKNNLINTVKLNYGSIGRDLVRKKSTIEALKLIISMQNN